MDVPRINADSSISHHGLPPRYRSSLDAGRIESAPLSNFTLSWIDRIALALLSPGPLSKMAAPKADMRLAGTKLDERK